MRAGAKSAAEESLSHDLDASSEQRYLRTLLSDSDQWVKMRTRVQHTLQAMALRSWTSRWKEQAQQRAQARRLFKMEGNEVYVQI